MAEPKPKVSYADVGVDTLGVQSDIRSLTGILRGTFANREDVVLDFGYFANIIDIGGGRGIAIATDGVGTKLLVAEMAGKYDTVGIDCIAMNANDLLCVGATPIALVDYVAVEELNTEVLTALAEGLVEGARRAQISIPGGEIAQVREMVRGAASGGGIDLVGTCIGVVDLDKIIVGKNVSRGDVVIGVESSGLHSNGFTLARRVLLQDAGMALTDTPPGWTRTLGDELLIPTHIYVQETVALFREGLPVRALAHITGDGLTNLARIDSPMGFVIDALPEPHRVMRLIQDKGAMSDAEMYTVFNMGVGFCVVVPADAVEDALAVIRSHGKQAQVLGRAVEDAQRRIRLEPVGLVSEGAEFVRAK